MAGSHPTEPSTTTGAGAPRTKHDASVPELVSDLADEFTTLVRQEVQLAKAELKTEVRQAGKAGGLLGGAGGAAALAVLLLAFAAAWGLSEVMAPGLAFLIVGVISALIAAVLGLTGRKTAQSIDPSPRRTLETLKEDAEWVRSPRNSAGDTGRGHGA